MFLNKYEYVYKNTMKCFGTIFLNISDNYPEHCELFSNIFFHLTLCLKCLQTKKNRKPVKWKLVREKNKKCEQEEANEKKN